MSNGDEDAATRKLNDAMRKLNDQLEGAHRKELRRVERTLQDVQEDFRRYVVWRNLLLASFGVEMMLFSVALFFDAGWLGIPALLSLAISTIAATVYYLQNHTHGRNRHLVRLRAVKREHEDLLLDGPGLFD